jgi:hypothetical protein
VSKLEQSRVQTTQKAIENDQEEGLCWVKQQTFVWFQHNQRKCASNASLCELITFWFNNWPKANDLCTQCANNALTESKSIDFDQMIDIKALLGLLWGAKVIVFVNPRKGFKFEMRQY